MSSVRLNIEDRIKAAIGEEIADVKEGFIQESLKAYEKKLREIVGKVAVNVANLYSVEQMGTILHVRIQTGESNGTGS